MVGGREAIVVAAYALGALLVAGQAAVHIQQYFDFYHDVRWIGPLFIADAVASVLVIGGLAVRRWQPLAALAGIVVAGGALAGLAVSYGRGLFGWQEIGFATPVELAVIFELGAVIVLAAAVAADAAWSKHG
jgi:hypothetical protein